MEQNAITKSYCPCCWISIWVNDILVRLKKIFPQGVTMYCNRILMLDVQSYYYGTGRCCVWRVTHCSFGICIRYSSYLHDKQSGRFYQIWQMQIVIFHRSIVFQIEKLQIKIGNGDCLRPESIFLIRSQFVSTKVQGVKTHIWICQIPW